MDFICRRSMNRTKGQYLYGRNGRVPGYMVQKRQERLFICAIAESETVYLLVEAGELDHAQMIIEAVRKEKNYQKNYPVHYMEIASDDAWARDVGPTFVVNGQGQVRGIDWCFNAWGGICDGLYAD